VTSSPFAIFVEGIWKGVSGMPESGIGKHQISPGVVDTWAELFKAGLR